MQIKKDVHEHFNAMCENAYQKSFILDISDTVCACVPKDRVHMLSFFRHYLNAVELSNNMNHMTSDLLNNISTPATFLMKARYGSRYIHMMMRSRISLSMRLAEGSLRKMSGFDHEKCMRLCVKEC